MKNSKSIKSRVIRIINLKQQAKLLRAAFQTNKVICRAIILALFGGLRRRELLNLKFRDIDLKHMVLRVRSSTGRDHVVLISEVLAEWLALFPVGAPDDLVVPLSSSEFSRRLAQVQQVAGIRSFAKDFLRRAYSAYAMWVGVPLAMKKAMLGHCPGAQSVTAHFYKSGKEFLAELTPSALQLGNSPTKQ